MTNFFKIKDFQLGEFCQPYIIAEIGVNHEGNMDLAKRLIKEAYEGGAHAVKFQSYKAEKIASKNSPAYWDTSKESTESQYKLFKKYDSFEPEHYLELAKYCETIGIDFSSTPFDLEAVDFLDPIVPFFKIASADITNTPLLRKVAKTGKPIILSTGASTIDEIKFAANMLQKAGAINIALLHCVLNYPTPPENAQLAGINKLKEEFKHLPIGYSDHVVPDETISALEMASLLGSCILEKHFTHDKNLPGNDHYHAMDKYDLQKFLNKIKKYKTLNGQKEKNLDLEKNAILHARRSIASNGFIKKGDYITENNIIAKRPGHGISPIYWDEIIGKKAIKDIEDDTLINWNMLL